MATTSFPSLTTSLPSSLPSYHLQLAVDEVMDKLQSLPKKDNLVPLFINAETGQLRPGTLTLGARADTYYEYLFKQWIQSSKTEPRYIPSLPLLILPFSHSHIQIPAVVSGLHGWSSASIATILPTKPPHIRGGGEGERRVLPQNGERCFAMP